MPTDCTASTRKNTPRSRQARPIGARSVRSPGANVTEEHVTTRVCSSMLAMICPRIDRPVTRRNDPHLYATPLKVEPGNYVVRMLQGGAEHHVIPRTPIKRGRDSIDALRNILDDRDIALVPADERCEFRSGSFDH